MRCSWVATAFVALTGAGVAHAQSGEDQVRRAIMDMNRAAERLDADAFMRSYWRSPRLTITFDAETMRGWDTIAREQRKWWADKNAGIRFEEQGPAEIVSQGKGVVTSLQHMRVSRAGDPKPARLVITSVWKKLPEGWRVVLAHESLVP
ncbi:nuclear transport factor 2 family protein [uncultured Sphingomonas sp.]|uniref:YybH family protein n=1 Tax=uncultured Sphingomonas sp. TaxID=158754 RepID=UPI0026038D66|nr:nuclear transport factor 2 family protein [uncultured Sphingomonas sp.]